MVTLSKMQGKSLRLIFNNRTQEYANKHQTPSNVSPPYFLLQLGQQSFQCSAFLTKKKHVRRVYIGPVFFQFQTPKTCTSIEEGQKLEQSVRVQHNFAESCQPINRMTDQVTSTHITTTCSFCVRAFTT